MTQISRLFEWLLTKEKGDEMKILGFILIAVGIGALLNVIWPVIFIGIGLVVLARSMSVKPLRKEGMWVWLGWPTFKRKGDADSETGEPEGGKI